MDKQRIFVKILIFLLLTFILLHVRTGIYSETFGKKVIKFGVVSRYNPRIMYQNYQPLMDYLSQNSEFDFELKLGKDYEETIVFLEKGIVDIAFLGAVTFLEANKKFGAQAILRPLNKDGEPYYKSITIVRKDSKLNSLADLKGKSFAFASTKSTSGNLIPRYYLAKAGVHLKDLKKYVNLEYYDSVVKSVLKGEYDAGAVKDIIAYRYQEHGLRFLFISEPIASEPIVVREDASQKLIEAVKKALLAIDPLDPKYKEIMASWSDEFKYGFIESTDVDYDSARKLLNAIPKGCGLGCHPKIYF